MIKCHLNITPSKECYEVCVQSRRCEALKMWESMAIEALSAQLDNNSTKVDNKNDELVRRQDVIKMIQETNISSGMTKARLLIKAQNLPVVQENIIRCKDCEKHESIYCTMSEEFDNGTNPEDFCSYAENACENTCDFTRMSHAKDTIYRQDAIDALEEQLDYLRTLNKDENPTAESKWYGVNWARNTIADLPSAQPEPLTDKEQRIFLAAMGREEEVCKEVDEECRNCREPYEDSLVRICHEITRKVKGALWTI